MRRQSLSAASVLLSAILAAPNAIAHPRPMRHAPPTPAPAFPADRLDKLRAALPEVEKLVDGVYAQSGWPGLAVGLIVDGELVWSKAYGVRDVESGAPVTTDSAFRIASMTKSFTATAILQLRDARKLS